MGRTLVIGDIHGALKALQQVFEKAKVTPDDTLIFLGDYVDGWSQSAPLISYLIALKEKQHCIFIRGNHDELCYKWLNENTYNPEWLKHGGQTTIDSYSKLSPEEIKLHKKFYEHLLDYHIDPQNRLFLHAGFTNLHGPEKEYFSKLFYWDRTLWETALSLDTQLTKSDLKYPKRLLLFDEIYIGHTPVTRIGKTTPVNAACVWNIDTGAAFQGPLTILDTDTKTYWQSDPVFKLYPDEKGRN
ncbi:serine/threonine protein phosphatase [Aquimarina sp. U1-2]|uniref:metallophosphoesterase family protein n=1 Tax=Aquimarina sp. U1-2 TaxID=2823141 RepID=UPI001AEC9013|nr:metallophosphoesterase family protein [Aquimarina sp. U1-2]MBP2833336.1 serine/threonine protein phosphatase [Aquimarina sp. U1-2]